MQSGGSGGLLDASNPTLSSLISKARQQNDSDSESDLSDKDEDWD